METEVAEMFTPENTALVLVDMQKRFIDAMWEPERLLRNVSAFVRAARMLDMPILWLEQNNERLGGTDERISAHLSGLKPISKMAFSGYYEEPCKKLFDRFNRDNVYIVGIEAHVCVFQTAFDLLAAGKTVQVVADAVSSRKRDNMEIALKELNNLGAGLATLESGIFELLRTADHPKFKEVQALVK